MAYLTAVEIETRLSLRFDITVILNEADVEIAHQGLERMGPFVGTRYDYEQVDVFPRSVTLTGDTEGQTPEAVLDFIALRAASLSIAEEVTPLSSESEGLSGLSESKSYSRPKISKVEAYLRNTMARLSRYRRTFGELI